MTKRFEISGEPKGKGRPRFTTINGHAHATTPKETAQYENLVRLEYKAQCGDFMFEDGKPIYTLIDCFMTIPASASKKKQAGMLDGEIRPMKKPDFDNVGKIICDSLNGIAYRDDSQIVDGHVRKFYGQRPHVVVTLSDQPIEMDVIHPIH